VKRVIISGILRSRRISWDRSQPRTRPDRWRRFHRRSRNFTRRLFRHLFDKNGAGNHRKSQKFAKMRFVEVSRRQVRKWRWGRKFECRICRTKFKRNGHWRRRGQTWAATPASQPRWPWRVDHNRFEEEKVKMKLLWFGELDAKLWTKRNVWTKKVLSDLKLNRFSDRNQSNFLFSKWNFFSS
jgi:hypothetical protein